MYRECFVLDDMDKLEGTLAGHNKRLDGIAEDLLNLQASLVAIKDGLFNVTEVLATLKDVTKLKAFGGSKNQEDKDQHTCKYSITFQA